MQQIILLNLLGMCVSFLLLCQYERGHEGNIEGLTREAPIVLITTIVWPMGVLVWCLMNTDKLFKERKWFWKQEK